MTKLSIKLAGRLFRRSRAGNVSMMFALILPILIFAIGMAVDYTRAASVRTSLNAAADAAVLSALTPAMLQQSNSVAQTEAQNMFNAEIASLSSLIPGDTVVTVSVTNSANNPLMRIVTLNYSVQSRTIFSGDSEHGLDGHWRVLDRAGLGSAKHRFLSAARQFAFDVAAGDQRGDHRDADGDVDAV